MDSSVLKPNGITKFSGNKSNHISASKTLATWFESQIRMRLWQHHSVKKQCVHFLRACLFFVFKYGVMQHTILTPEENLTI